ncbi:MAG: D-alanine--D-alanine ligase [Lachnospiraceae bacterium]|nr:D-alanine--D-alanine ligase [Lachnospiraceae bacterium]MDY5742342.1 D-alanine--D-alanine ligase [Lachnospiraceae bacterium]
MKIVVLAGGISTERAVSIVSGTGIAMALQAKGHDVILADVYAGYFGSLDEEGWKQANLLEMSAWIQAVDIQEERSGQPQGFFGHGILELCRQADIVFLGLHGEDGENGKVQAAFDLLGIKYTGSGHLGSAVAMDKELSKQLFRSAGIPTPAGIALRRGEEVPAFPLPAVVKPACGGSSVGVSIARTEEELRAAVAEAFSYEEKILIEQYISGREFSVGVVEGVAYPVIEIAPVEGFYDYQNKYKPGAAVETCPAQLSDEKTRQMQAHAEAVMEVLHLDGYARMDFLMDEEENLYCLEANTLPGMTPTSLLPQEAAVLCIDYASLCERLIEVSQKIQR